jgi:hypothetical protein
MRMDGDDDHECRSYTKKQTRETFFHASLYHFRCEKVCFTHSLDGNFSIILQQNRTNSFGWMLEIKMFSVRQHRHTLYIVLNSQTVIYTGPL